MVPHPTFVIFKAPLPGKDGPGIHATCKECGWKNIAKTTDRARFMHSLTVHEIHFCKGTKP